MKPLILTLALTLGLTASPTADEGDCYDQYAHDLFVCEWTAWYCHEMCDITDDTRICHAGCDYAERACSDRALDDLFDCLGLSEIVVKGGPIWRAFRAAEGVKDA